MIEAAQFTLLADDDADAEYYDYRHCALQHRRAPSPSIPQFSSPAALRPMMLRPCSPPLLPPRAWGFGTLYPSFRALPPSLEQCPSVVELPTTAAPHEPRLAHTNDTTRTTRVLLPFPPPPLVEVR